MNNEIIDIYDLVAEDANLQQFSEFENIISVDDALLVCLNSYGGVNLEYISEISQMEIKDVIEQLKGTIFQNPEPFLAGQLYNMGDNWELSSNYLSGNVRRKLARAVKADKIFGGAFKENINSLKAIMPDRVDIEDIHIAPGAPWIPVEEVAQFIAFFLRLKNEPEVYFYEDLMTYKIMGTDEAKKSVLNTITYGVKGDAAEYGSDYVKQYLTALDIIEQTMNAKTIKVYDYILKGTRDSYEYEPVLNQAKTLEAQNKQKAIIDAFCEYVYCDEKIMARFEQYYNDRLVGYTYTQYDGSFLKLPDLNPDVKLYKHQRDAIARVLLSGNNLLLAHDVGAGKTYEMIVSLHELHRMGKSPKNLMVVPNNVLQATVDAHKYLYKDDNILVIYPKDFTPDSRNALLEKLRDNDYVAAYMAYSSFDMVVMSKEYYVDKMTDEIKALRNAIYNTSVKHEKATLRSKKEKLEKQLSKRIAEDNNCPWLTYDALGITTLVVDEAHNYKNIPIQTRADSIVGLGGSSKKCREMLEKAHFTDRLIFATGTPLTNSLADLYTLQVYLQPTTLEYHQINTFDTWVNTFGKRETTIECDVDANSSKLRAMTRFSSFHNLSELMSLFSQVCDFHNIDNAEEGLPKFHGYENISVAKSEGLAFFQKKLSLRTDNIHLRLVKRNEDNLLKVTNDGRHAALDMRLVECEVPYDDSYYSKTDACADKVFELYLKYPSSVQVVFSDIGTPKSRFNVYDELASKLERLGVPSYEVAFVHDAVTEKARAKLFADMNSGTVRVVVGSTAKLGVGVNVQERLVALHHLSVPWRPADMVQREGRILRKGNTSPEVFIFRYITEGSFDAYSWQLLENKQRFISSFLSGTSAFRDMDDIDGAVLTYAEIKALAIGNPLIKKRVEVSNSLGRMKVSFKNRQKEIMHLKEVAKTLPKKIERAKAISELTRLDSRFYRSNKEAVSNADRSAFGEELLFALHSNIGYPEEREFDYYQGFTVLLPANMTEKYSFIILCGPFGSRHNCNIELENKTPLGCTKSIDFILEHLFEKALKYRSERKSLKQQQSEIKENLEHENQYDAEIAALKSELEEIDKEIERQSKELEAKAKEQAEKIKNETA